MALFTTMDELKRLVQKHSVVRAEWRAVMVETTCSVWNGRDSDELCGLVDETVTRRQLTKFIQFDGLDKLIIVKPTQKELETLVGKQVFGQRGSRAYTEFFPTEQCSLHKVCADGTLDWVDRVFTTVHRDGWESECEDFKSAETGFNWSKDRVEVRDEFGKILLKRD